MSSFYKLFYGPSATRMGRLYQLLSEQGQFWKESWETKPSAARTPLWGDWNIIYPTPRPARGSNPAAATDSLDAASHAGLRLGSAEYSPARDGRQIPGRQ